MEKLEFDEPVTICRILPPTHAGGSPAPCDARICPRVPTLTEVPVEIGPRKVVVATEVPNVLEPDHVLVEVRETPPPAVGEDTCTVPSANLIELIASCPATVMDAILIPLEFFQS